MFEGVVCVPLPLRNQAMMRLTLLLLFAFSSVAFGQATPPAQTAPPTAGSAPEQAISPEARAAVMKGNEQINAKNYKAAIQTFLAAARRHPENGQFRHLLGFAYAQDKQYGPAWVQLRQAVRLNPFYEPGVRHFLSLWNDFDNRGLMNPGLPQAEVVRLLGEPDKQTGNAERLIVEYGFMQIHFQKGRLFAIVDPRGLDPANARPLDVVEINFDDKARWRLGYRAINRLQSLTEYVPAGEAVQKWKELYTVQRLYNMSTKTSPKKMATEIEANLRKANAEIDFQLLADSETDVMFHWREKAGEGREAQHEIVRLISGQKDIHRIAYGRKVAQIPNAEAQAWFKLLRSAKLQASPPTTPPTSQTAPEQTPQTTPAATGASGSP